MLGVKPSPLESLLVLLDDPGRTERKTTSGAAKVLSSPEFIAQITAEENAIKELEAQKKQRKEERECKTLERAEAKKEKERLKREKERLEKNALKQARSSVSKPRNSKPVQPSSKMKPKKLAPVGSTSECSVRLNVYIVYLLV